MKAKQHARGELYDGSYGEEGRALDTPAKIGARRGHRRRAVSEPLLNTKACAAYFGGVDVSTIQRWCVENEFPHVRGVGRRGRIFSKASWIDTWVMKNAKFVVEG